MRRFGFGIFFAACLTALSATAQTPISFRTPGADEDLRDALWATSLLVQSQEREEGSDPQEVLANARADYGRLIGILYSRGHYGGVITIRIDGREAASIPPLAAPRSIGRIDMEIRPGPVYLFSEAQVAPLASGTEIPDGFARGEPAETDVIRDAASAAVEGWRDVGHAKAEIGDQRIVARHNERRIAANLAVAPGPRLRFGRVTVSGQQDVRTSRILTIAGLEEGRVYSPEEIAAAERRLRRTGTFRSVVIEESDTVVNGDELPLDIRVVEQTPRRFGFGAEYSTIEGVRLSGFWLHRNFLGGAERFRVDGEIAGIAGETGGTDYSLGFRYERPATPRADTDLFATLSFESLDEPEFESKTTEFTLGFTRYATEELTVSYGVGYLYSEVTDDFGSEIYNMITLPLTATLDRRNSALDPKSGIYADVELTPFYGLSGTESGGRLTFDTRGYKSFGEDDRFTAAARIQVGSLFGPALLDTPPFYRFYSGGGGTVRGQDYQSLGVELGGGDRTGGRSFLGLSGELRAGITETIDVVAFYDWGYIGEEAFVDFSGESHSGAGLGLRYNTGIGPIRLDVATPVSGDTDASSYYVYIGIGQAF